jgi:hypothetical protein
LILDKLMVLENRGEKGLGMSTVAMLPAGVDSDEAEFGVDFIEEIRLRTWARKNYAPSRERQRSWHPVILDEMRRIDHER